MSVKFLLMIIACVAAIVLGDVANSSVSSKSSLSVESPASIARPAAMSETNLPQAPVTDSLEAALKDTKRILIAEKLKLGYKLQKVNATKLDVSVASSNVKTAATTRYYYWNGRYYTQGEIIGIIIGFIALVLFIIIFFICLCCGCCCFSTCACAFCPRGGNGSKQDTVHLTVFNNGNEKGTVYAANDQQQPQMQQQQPQMQQQQPQMMQQPQMQQQPQMMQQPQMQQQQSVGYNQQQPQMQQQQPHQYQEQQTIQPENYQQQPHAQQEPKMQQPPQYQEQQPEMPSASVDSAIPAVPPRPDGTARV